MSEQHLEGGCCCGAVRYRAPLPVRACFNCHCSICRRLSGAAYSPWVAVWKDRFSITRGADALTTFQVSPRALRAFCARCGTPIWGEDTEYPDAIGLLLGTIDLAHDIPPRSHTFYDSRAGWLDGEASIPRLGGVTGFEPLDKRGR